MANKPILQTSADLAASQTAGAPALVMPTGVVLPYAGTAAPSGWLACDGSAVSRTTYASLFASVGTSFGAGDGSTTFNLPDLRGRFPRFNDAMFGGSAAGRDTGRVHGTAQAQATAKNGLTNAASTVTGSISETSALSNSNTIVSSNDFKSNQGNNTFAAPGFTAMGSVSAQSYALNHSHTISHSLTAPAQTITGDVETRPINLSINAIIKV